GSRAGCAGRRRRARGSGARARGSCARDGCARDGDPRRGCGGGGVRDEMCASLVKELRERTGAGMMDCKRALQETNGDMDAAVVLLREKGRAQAAERAERETTEGKVGYRLVPDGSQGTMVAVGCETEPVSNNQGFPSVAKK